HDEIINAENKIAEVTGQSHRILAYPYGEYDAQTRALVKELQFVAFGQQSGPLRTSDDLQALPRFSFGGNYGSAEDFALKVNTQPFPLQSLVFFKDIKLQQPLEDVVLAPAQKPVVALTLVDQKLLSRVQCFASGQGAIAVSVADKQLLVQANQ